MLAYRESHTAPYTVAAVLYLRLGVVSYPVLYTVPYTLRFCPLSQAQGGVAFAQVSGACRFILSFSQCNVTSNSAASEVALQLA